MSASSHDAQGVYAGGVAEAVIRHAATPSTLMKKKKLIAIVGPTASGKTGLGVFLAKKLRGEVVSADSRQVYRGLDIGTGKEGAPKSKVKSQKSKLQLKNQKLEELAKDIRWIDDVPQWMVDVVEPEERFTLFNYLELARKVIDDIFARGKVPIIVGGTGLYVSALVEGYQLDKSLLSSRAERSGVERSAKTNRSFDSRWAEPLGAAAQDDITGQIAAVASGSLAMTKYSREELERMTLEELQGIISSLISYFPFLISPTSSLAIQNPRRMIRAIERVQAGEEMTKSKPDFESLILAIDIPREELYKRIDKRADERFKAGMLEETRDLIKKGVDFWWLLTLGLDYRIMTQYLISDKKGAVDYKEMVERFKFAEHNYARRQLTWWRKKKNIVWISDKNQMVKEAGKFLRT